MRNTIIVFLIGILSLGFTSCNSKDLRIFDGNIAIDDKWERENYVEFNVMVDDISHTYDVVFHIRVNGLYKYKTLPIKVFVQDPDNGEIAIEELVFDIYDDNNLRLGAGVGDIRDCDISYAKNLIFPQSGFYSFRVAQNLTNDFVSGIMDIGLTIQKSK